MTPSVAARCRVALAGCFMPQRTGRSLVVDSGPVQPGKRFPSPGAAAPNVEGARRRPGHSPVGRRTPVSRRDAAGAVITDPDLLLARCPAAPRSISHLPGTGDPAPRARPSSAPRHRRSRPPTRPAGAARAQPAFLRPRPAGCPVLTSSRTGWSRRSGQPPATTGAAAWNSAAASPRAEPQDVLREPQAVPLASGPGAWPRAMRAQAEQVAAWLEPAPRAGRPRWRPRLWEPDRPGPVRKERRLRHGQLPAPAVGSP